MFGGYNFPYSFYPVIIFIFLLNKSVIIFIKIHLRKNSLHLKSNIKDNIFLNLRFLSKI